MFWNIAALVGVPGVGKTSLSRITAGELGFKHVNYGELMLEVAQSNDLASNQEDMFNLEIEVQQFIWQTAAYKLKRLCKLQNNIIVDMHGVDKADVGYIVSLPIETLCPDIIIVVEASYEQIIQRRMSDKDRNRPIDNIKILNEQMEILRKSMMVCSVVCDSYLKVIDNDNFQDSLNEIKDVLCGSPVYH
jgi:adenylate kinase